MDLTNPKQKKRLYQTLLTDYSTTDLEGAGTLREDSEGNVYRWVQNDNASAAMVVGQPVCYQVASIGTNMFKGVKTPATADLYLFAGLAMSACPAASYFWVLIKGYYSAARVDAPVTTAIAAYDTLIPANGLTHLLRSTAAGTAPVKPDAVLTLEAVATVSTGSTTTAKVLVRGQ